MYDYIKVVYYAVGYVKMKSKFKCEKYIKHDYDVRIDNYIYTHMSITKVTSEIERIKRKTIKNRYSIHLNYDNINPNFLTVVICYEGLSVFCTQIGLVALFCQVCNHDLHS